MSDATSHMPLIMSVAAARCACGWQPGTAHDRDVTYHRDQKVAVHKCLRCKARWIVVDGESKRLSEASEAVPCTNP